MNKMIKMTVDMFKVYQMTNLKEDTVSHWIVAEKIDHMAYVKPISSVMDPGTRRFFGGGIELPEIWADNYNFICGNWEYKVPLLEQFYSLGSIGSEQEFRMKKDLEKTHYIQELPFTDNKSQWNDLLGTYWNNLKDDR